MKIYTYTGILLLFIAKTVTAQDKQKLTTQLNAAFDTIFQSGQPGGSVLIRKNGEVLYQQSFGLADLKTKEKFTEKTISNTGSISKTFVSYGILILQNWGQLSIEDPISKYFPDFRNKDIAGKVKIKHLMTHTSGLPDSRNVSKDPTFYLTAKDEENFAPLKKTDTLEFEPGSLNKYSNPSFNGLALIIEKVFKLKWQKFIDNHIFKPSGMKQSRITDGSSPDKKVAHGYRIVNGLFEEYDYGEYPTFAAAGNGGVWSSVEELAKYADAIRKCLFLDCKTVEFSKTAWTPENWKGKNKPMQGYSWFIGQVGKNNYKTVEHTGSQGGFRAHMIMIDEPGIDIIWLTNNDRMVTRQIMDAMVAAGFL